ncbi:MAG: hypothetical protein IPK85_03345 [Gemmatimonadetes bacterium]|nr:hypothetical protein [Gemmatimonadota bacterium]
MSKQDGQEAVVKVDVPGTGHYGAVVLNLRDHFAAHALTGMCSPVGDGGVFPPDYETSDFEPWPKGHCEDLVYCQVKDGSWRAFMREDVKKRDGEPHRLIGSYERAIARQAYRFADSMLAARSAPHQEQP